MRWLNESVFVDALCSPALSIELFAPKLRWNLEAQFTSLFVVSLFLWVW